MQKFRSLYQLLTLAFSISIGLFIIFTYIIGTMAWSYSINYMNDALDTITLILDLQPPNLGLKQGVLVSTLIFGAFVGCLITYSLIEKLPRRAILQIIDCIFISGSLLTIIQNYYLILVGRLLQGMSSGITSILMPIVLKEISPVEIYSIIGGQNLVLQDLKQSAEAQKFISKYYKEEHQQEVLEFYVQQQKIRDSKTKWSIPMLFKKDMAVRMRLAIAVNIIQQITGVNAVIQYSTIIFQEITSAHWARVLTLIIAVMRIFMYSSSVVVWQKYGRRKPILYGLGLLLVMDLGIGACLYLNENGIGNGFYLGVGIIVQTFVFFIGFLHSLGPIAIYCAEIVPETGVVVATTAQWTFNIFITLSFPIIKEELGVSFSFGIYGVLTFISFVYLLFAAKETKGLTEAEVEQLFRKKKKGKFEIFKEEQENLKQEYYTNRPESHMSEDTQAI